MSLYKWDMKTITRSEDYAVKGLLQVAQNKMSEINFLEKEIRKILGDTDGGHTSDAIFGGINADTETLYQRLGITVNRKNSVGRPKIKK
jgi:hypothetical protein